ncbi:alginate O-acetyltransferase AlgX-related protein [Tropicibacter naphthalenivorans]|uniref:AlgX/AlgJ SGNH hydrolase-like domain-containing protein n=1 Tax=Tropicibacter naphthalenivorans TaxID=441103 RepID=A0A0P1GZ89_9RHOB|nr:hypothetical protein [Tropicibacter naphthalenivorans]CUH80078.1 hypothetical protein TRN7648_02798 [Tropicibacter naphthalenivorans]SMC84385.1 alginate biosynthesis protein AlgX [Tropicibacter naphthalenivorans]
MTRMLNCSMAVALALLAGTAQADSAYGCAGLETNRELPTIEGKDGVFFRINADLRMNHPFAPEVVDQMAALSQALESRGTTLIYVPIPTKSVSMPDHLPDRARLYGFDLDVATAVHDDVLARLNAAGVLTADIRAALLRAEPGKLAFFNSDFHWSAYGADLGAQAIAEVIRAQPIYDALDKTTYTSTPLGEEIAFSGMRRILQARCNDTLPEPTTMTWDTQATVLDLGLDGALDLGLGDESGGLDIFGDDTAQMPVALVGTSFSDSPINNFPGFIAQHAALEVVNFAITGGNQFGAITSYLTSTEFQDSPPAFLVWENPIYNNLAQYGDQPMRELIAAASGTCTQPLDAALSEDRLTLTASVAGLGAQDTLFLDSDGSTALDVTYRFEAAQGTRVKALRRGERLRRTGRFYMPMTGLWEDGAETVSITLSAPMGPQASLSKCSATPLMEEKS